MIPSPAKAYVSARTAAAAFGCTHDAVVADIESTDALGVIGGKYGAVWIVEAFEVQEPRLSMHRRRLANSASAVPLPGRLQGGLSQESPLPGRGAADSTTATADTTTPSREAE